MPIFIYSDQELEALTALSKKEEQTIKKDILHEEKQDNKAFLEVMHYLEALGAKKENDKNPNHI